MLTGEEKKGRRETVTWEQIEAYLAQLGEKGCSAQTLSSYRWDLRSFWESLPQGELDRFTVLRWQEQMREKGYRLSTIKHRVSSANRLLAHLGLWEFQSEPPAQSQTERQPQLTRREYLQLLRAARSQGKTRTYLLIKVFACTGMPINNLEQLTVESLDDPELPESLAKELREFAGEQGLTAGPVFVARSGQGISRANVTASIQRLAGAAGLPAEKCNPRCLQRLYHTTMEEIQQNVSTLVRQAYHNLLEQEQLAVGLGQERFS